MTAYKVFAETVGSSDWFDPTRDDQFDRRFVSSTDAPSGDPRPTYLKTRRVRAQPTRASRASLRVPTVVRRHDASAANCLTEATARSDDRRTERSIGNDRRTESDATTEDARHNRRTRHATTTAHTTKDGR
jgi:hypothetical protein